MAELIKVRATRHLRGGYAPGWVYEVDPEDPNVAYHIKNRGLVPHPDAPAAEPESEPVAEAAAAPETDAEELEDTPSEE